MGQIEFSIVRSARRVTNTSISVGPKGVIVHAPVWVPVWVIKRFVEEKRDWIESQLSKRPHQVRKREFSDGDTIYYLGKEYSIKIISLDDRSRSSVTLSEQIMIIEISVYFTEDKRHEEIKKTISRWFLEKGIEHITQRVNEYSQIIGVDYSKITLKDVSSIWGSCSSKNNLNFNRHLIMAPQEVIDYVVIHEVCHLVHRDHSSRFWGLVRSLDPNYKEHRRWLRDNRNFLVF